MQQLMLGFRGPKIPDWLKELSAEHGLGGVILFDFNFQTKAYENNIYVPSQLEDLAGEIHALPSRPLLFIDQEGGKVRRLKEKLGFKNLPSAQVMGQMPDDELEPILRESFLEMKNLGVDVDLMPSVDLNTNPSNPDIGKVERSFSASPETVNAKVELINRVALDVGLGLTLKHYPGLGGASVNSHLELTDISGTVSNAQLELFFDWANRLWTPSVLVSHGIMNEWEPEVPVSASQVAIQKLRTRAPDALLMSDDVQMQGLQKKMTTPQAIEKGLCAGLDMIIVGNNMMPEDEQALAWAKSLAEKCQKDSQLNLAMEAAKKRVLHFKSHFASTKKGGLNASPNLS